MKHVSIDAMAFMPASIQINIGDTVRWTNKDSMSHTITDDQQVKPKCMNSGDVAPGSSYDFTFDTAGTFNYHCEYHKHMQGVIVVS